MMKANRQLAIVIAQNDRQRAKGRSTARENLLAANEARNCEIAGDDLLLTLALNARSRGDRRELDLLLAELKVPRAKLATFKAQNITAVLARKHGLSAPQIRTILKNWKARYDAS